RARATASSSPALSARSVPTSRSTARPRTPSVSSRPNVLRRLVLLAVLVIACAPSAAPPTSATRSGGTLVFAWQQPDTLNPLYSTGTQTNALALRLAVEGLVGIGPDGAPYAALAETIPTVANGCVTISGGAMGVPFLERFLVRFVASVNAAKAQLRAGEVDAMGSLAEPDVADLEKDTTIAIASAPSPTVEAIAFNFASPRDPANANPVLGDIVVRRALVLATPKAQIDERLVFGRATPAMSEIPVGWAAPAVAQESYDPAAARTMLEKDGWRPGADGIRSKFGVRASLRLVSTTGNALRERVQQVLVDEWRGIGI